MKFCKAPLKYALVVYFLTLLPVLLAESPRIAPCLERMDNPVLKTAGKLFDEAGKRTGFARFSEWQKATLTHAQKELTTGLDTFFAARTEKAEAPAQVIATESSIRAPLAEKTPPPLVPPTVVTELPTPNLPPAPPVPPSMKETEQAFANRFGEKPETNAVGPQSAGEETPSATGAPIRIAELSAPQTAPLPEDARKTGHTPPADLAPKTPQNAHGSGNAVSFLAKIATGEDDSAADTRANQDAADIPQAKDAAPRPSASAKVPPVIPKTKEPPAKEDSSAPTDAPHQATEQFPRPENTSVLQPSPLAELPPVPGAPTPAGSVTGREMPAAPAPPLANAPLPAPAGPGKDPGTDAAPGTGGKEPSSAALRPSVHDPASKSVSDAPRTSKRILIIGDSFIMEGFGPTLHKTLMTYQDVEVIREGKYSTGLTRQDLFDWPEKARDLAQRLRPDVVCICLGANDPQDIIDSKKKRHIVGTDSWQTLYYERVKNMLEAASSADAQVLWIGLPIMGKAKYETQIRLLTSLQQKACDENSRYVFLATEESLKDEQGNYTTFAKDSKNRHVRIRSKDKIHVTGEGGKLMVESILPSMESLLALQKKTPDSTKKPN